ncbi:hypothetical protein SJS42_10235 [Aeromonas caviae]|uniref:hypothetical protein n=1 Tax=Aeromonas caviae TaxID=648 RepID=UPI0029D4583F|nr:hypothetical protein [Aeromonas caviae]MDX7799011.1 hypothetical protein [Aeromonas caviae]
MTKKISIQVWRDDKEFIELINSDKDLECTTLVTSSFDGQTEVMTLILSITSLSLSFLVKVISEQIKSKKYVKLVYKGVQIQGVSEKTILKILNEIKNEAD